MPYGFESHLPHINNKQQLMKNLIALLALTLAIVSCTVNNHYTAPPEIWYRNVNGDSIKGRLDTTRVLPSNGNKIWFYQDTRPRNSRNQKWCYNLHHHVG